MKVSNWRCKAWVETQRVGVPVAWLQNEDGVTAMLKRRVQGGGRRRRRRAAPELPPTSKAGKTFKRAGWPKKGTRGPRSSRRSANGDGQAPALIARKQPVAVITEIYRSQPRLSGARVPAHLSLFDQWVRHALVDAGNRQPHALAAMREEFPVAPMKAAPLVRARRQTTPSRARTRCTGLDERLQAEALDEGAAKIVPHGRRPFVRSFRLCPGKRAPDWQACASSRRARGDHAPEAPGQPRRRFQRQRARNGPGEEEAGEFEPVTQGFGKPHSRPGRHHGRRRGPEWLTLLISRCILAVAPSPSRTIGVRRQPAALTSSAVGGHCTQGNPGGVDVASSST